MGHAGRRCAGAWNAAPSSAAAAAACVRCAMEANITACGAPINQSAAPSALEAPELQPSAVVQRWCEGWQPFTTGAGCRSPTGGGPAIYEDELFARFASEKVAAHHNPETPLFVSTRASDLLLETF